MNAQDSIGGIVIIPFLAEKNRQAIVCLKDLQQSIPRWKFPGGKVFEGENKEAAARRIIHQEIGRTICAPDDYASFTLFEIDVSCVRQFREKTVFYADITKRILSANSQFLSPKGYRVQLFSKEQILGLEKNFLNLHRKYFAVLAEALNL
jgi:8-oxo-dGTP pyrophosphatase MutT (NUDIX family)